MAAGRGRIVLGGLAVVVAVGACGGVPDYQGSGGAVAAGPVRPVESMPGMDAAAAASPAAEETDTETWQTKWGPLSAADRELVSKVRLATLWEMVMAEEAIQRAQSPRVREISEMIAAQHQVLDRDVRSLAAKLKVKLPIRPTDKQQEWMADISSRTGSDYDATYVKWLRFAHGQIFTLIGTVRGTTQNTLVRRFSESANTAVLNHQRLLESTGLTRPDSFPSPPAA